MSRLVARPRRRMWKKAIVASRDQVSMTASATQTLARATRPMRANAASRDCTCQTAATNASHQGKRCRRLTTKASPEARPELVKLSMEWRPAFPNDHTSLCFHYRHFPAAYGYKYI